MKLAQLYEARYVSPNTGIQTAELGLYEDGPEPMEINKNGLTPFFAHCLAEYGNEGVGRVHISTVEEAFDEEDVIQRPHEYDPQYAEVIRRSMAQFLDIAKDAAGLFSIGVEYSGGYVAVSNIETDVIINALREYIVNHRDEFEISSDEDIEHYLNTGRRALED